jgi:hypothetical protein
MDRTEPRDKYHTDDPRVRKMSFNLWASADGYWLFTETGSLFDAYADGKDERQNEHGFGTLDAAIIWALGARA